MINIATINLPYSLYDVKFNQLREHRTGHDNDKSNRKIQYQTERTRIDRVSAANHDLILLLNKPYDYRDDGYKKISFFKEGAGIFYAPPYWREGTAIAELF
ncbi:hypothetical protein SAMN02746065_1532 [Desulfocicer vacuolatum DSM 3385]|uniref:Uncharacterized protein n=1 Tax=Desulfocicer vacuolatum DSM 3385 TaxID=1121400 RepID=A0A1W2EW63_9BACT|nr:hypothetical protein [Desulfocicer vacuolatum]SMD13900.1 hypothetical protein SAMN02746065_1532 [Desulfocicer vacuolatum DSM 3385]